MPDFVPPTAPGFTTPQHLWIKSLRIWEEPQGGPASTI